MRKNQNIAQITEFEYALVETVRHATFPIGSAHKRFIRDTLPVSKLSDRGRWFLAHIAHRYRRQFRLSQEQQAWVNDWLSKDCTLEPEPTSVSVRMESDGAQGSAVPLPEARKDEQLPSPVLSGWLFGGDEPQCHTKRELGPEGM